MTFTHTSTSEPSVEDGQYDEPFEIEPGTEYVAMVPAGGSLARFDTYDRADHPTRKTGLYELLDVPSFIQYVMTHAAPGTALYLDPEFGVLTAVFNDHTPDTAGWGDHRATVLLDEQMDADVDRIQNETGQAVLRGRPRTAV